MINPHSLGMADKGETVVFTGKNGTDMEQKKARTLFEPGRHLIVESCDIGNWSSTYRFDGVRGYFNTVMFEPVDAA